MPPKRKNSAEGDGTLSSDVRKRSVNPGPSSERRRKVVRRGQPVTVKRTPLPTQASQYEQNNQSSQHSVKQLAVGREPPEDVVLTHDDVGVKGEVVSGLQPESIFNPNHEGGIFGGTKVAEKHEAVLIGKNGDEEVFPQESGGEGLQSHSEGAGDDQQRTVSIGSGPFPMNTESPPASRIMFRSSGSDVGRDMQNVGKMIEELGKTQVEALKTYNNDFIETLNAVHANVESLREEVHAISDAVDCLCICVASVSNLKDMKSRNDLYLSPLENVYSGPMYKKAFTAFLCHNVCSITKSVRSRNGDSEEICKQIGIWMTHLFYALLPEQVKSESATSAEGKGHLSIRVSLNRFIIAVFENSSNTGVEEISLRSGVIKLKKPFWMRKGFVKHRHVMRAIYGFQSIPHTTKKRSSMSKPEETNETIAVELVKRVNQIHNGVLNRSRERCRDFFYESFGFVWEMVDVHVEDESGSLDLKSMEIPRAAVEGGNSRSKDKVNSENKTRWNHIVESFGSSFKFFFTYDVTVRDGGGTNSASIELRREANLLNTSVLFWMKLCGHTRTEEFLREGPQTFETVISTALTMRKLLKYHREVIDFEHGQTNELRLIQVLSPTSRQTRKRILDRITILSRKQFEEINVAEGAVSSTPVADEEENEEDEEDTLMVAARMFASNM